MFGLFKNPRILDLCKNGELERLRGTLYEIVSNLCEEGEFSDGRIRIYYGGEGKFWAEHTKSDEVWEIETLKDLKKFLEEIKNLER